MTEVIYEKNFNPVTPIVFRRGETAEPAVPGWTMPVDDLFETP